MVLGSFLSEIVTDGTKYAELQLRDATDKIDPLLERKVFTNKHTGHHCR